MEPATYFYQHYGDDLKVFAEDRVPLHGPFEGLCGMTLGRVFEPEYRKRYAAPDHFLCVVYFLNVLYQGVHAYFRSDYALWTSLSEPFPDVRNTCGHGGVSKPVDILRFARDPGYVPRATPLDLPKSLLAAYQGFFRHTYVPRLCELGRSGGGFEALNPGALWERLSEDLDTPEWQTFAGGT
jgi:hypothetical protein